MVTTKSQKNTPDLREKAIHAALTLAARDGWDSVSLETIARHAKISFPVLCEQFQDRNDILAAYGRMVDRRTIENIGAPDESASHRDRLFDILMERLDILNQDRAALTSILESFRCDPKQAVISLPYLGRSMSKMLEAASIDTTGLRGAAHVMALTTVYLMTLRTWVEDESPDMGKTMAALDRNLGRAEQVANLCGF